ncbi:hypothetical protein STEG23_015990 [Scotinomys teguina]
MCQLSWFLDPGGWGKAAAVGLYFIFPGICTLSLGISDRFEKTHDECQTKVQDGIHLIICTSFEGKCVFNELDFSAGVDMISRTVFTEARLAMQHEQKSAKEIHKLSEQKSDVAYLS